MHYTIDKKTPLPTGPWSVRYPWAKMEVGHSFTAEKRAGKSVYWHNKTHPDTRFTYRTEGENAIRIWRTA